MDMSVFGFGEEIEKVQKLDGGGEIDISAYDDEQFAAECPRCGFRFNLEGKENG